MVGRRLYDAIDLNEEALDRCLDKELVAEDDAADETLFVTRNVLYGDSDRFDSPMSLGSRDPALRWLDRELGRSVSLRDGGLDGV